MGNIHAYVITELLMSVDNAGRKPFNGQHHHRPGDQVPIVQMVSRISSKSVSAVVKMGSCAADAAGGWLEFINHEGCRFLRQVLILENKASLFKI